MAKGVSSVLMMADLGRGDDEQSRLDRPRPEQSMPVRLPRGNSERRGHGNYVRVGFRNAREKRGKPQVVANGEAELADRRAVDDDGALTGAVHGRFAPTLTGWKVDVEQVNLSLI